MTHRKAFTLIELLVVIAIIAVLMGILMPALTRVKEQARALKCIAILKQWSLAFAMYTDDNEGRFYNGQVNGADSGSGEWWREPMRPYTKEPELWLCPTAAKNRSVITAGRSTAQHPFDAWRTESSSGSDTGSYCPNGWIINLQRGRSGIYGRNGAAKYWKQVGMKNSANVPIMSEGWWVDAWPEDTDTPNPSGELPPNPIDGSPEMQRVCVNRHKGTQSVLFADWSASRISLKKLWRLKWHKTFRINQTVEWPQWMSGFSDK